MASTQCNHPIYCKGKLLDRIQNSGIFVDSKTFVDMPMKFNSSYIIDQFNLLPMNVSKDILEKFIKDHFREAGSDVVKIVPIDWVEKPRILSDNISTLKDKAVKDEVLREWGKAIHNKWKDLARTFEPTSNYSCNDCFSHIPVPNPFVVAGGRFREYYYWDTYWIIEGLLDSDMPITSRGIIENFLYIVNKYGFMPNGGRIYYLNRSQPPLLIQMVDKYYSKTGDIDLLRSALPILEKEYSFFMTNKSVNIYKNGKGYLLNRYNVRVSIPRPEAHKEDLHTAEEAIRSGFATNKESVYSELATGAESGWDFSSRWLDNPYKLYTIKTRDIVPVDLNCFMYKNEILMSKFYGIIGNTEKEIKYSNLAANRKEAIREIFWDSDSFMWYDYNIRKMSWNKNFYPSNLLPLWAEASHLTTDEALQLISNYLPFFSEIGGIPSSTFDNDLQWDSHNAWPPLQALVVEGLEKINSKEAKDIAFSIAQRWVTSNWCAWNATLSDGGMMFEKYNAKVVGMPGNGGEYEVQEGFGWTNGVALKFLADYGENLRLNDCQSD